MNLINEMSLSFPSKSSNEAFARSAVSAFIIGLDPTVAELSDIKTAVSEAVTNCIVHGYRRESGTVYINGKIYENNKVVIKIRDKGCGIADIEKAMEPLFTTAPEEDRAGLGFAVMQSFCDKVKVKSTVGKGTAVTLEKVISSGRLLSRGRYSVCRKAVVILSGIKTLSHKSIWDLSIPAVSILQAKEWNTKNCFRQVVWDLQKP